MLLSIIIPAYNVEPYIERCLLSLHHQDISNEDYEIIVVNDGSPDGLQMVVERLLDTIPNLILVNQENQGVSGARNNAISIAKGKYILPIDPDDYVVENSLKEILERAESLDADISYLMFEKIADDGEVIWSTNFKNYANEVSQDLNSFFATKGEKNVLSDPDRTWAVLYKKEILCEMMEPYPLKVPFLEDAIFLAKVFCLSKSMAFLDGRFYQRTIRPGSATNSNLIYTEGAKIGFELGFKHLMDFKSKIQKSNIDAQRMAYLNQVMIKFQVLHLNSEMRLNNRQLFEKIISNYSKQLKGIELKGIRSPYKFLGFAIKYFPSKFHFAIFLQKINAYRLNSMPKLKSIFRLL